MVLDVEKEHGKASNTVSKKRPHNIDREGKKVCFIRYNPDECVDNVSTLAIPKLEREMNVLKRSIYERVTWIAHGEDQELKSLFFSSWKPIANFLSELHNRMLVQNILWLARQKGFWLEAIWNWIGRQPVPKIAINSRLDWGRSKARIIGYPKSG